MIKEKIVVTKENMKEVYSKLTDFIGRRGGIVLEHVNVKCADNDITISYDKNTKGSILANFISIFVPKYQDWSGCKIPVGALELWIEYIEKGSNEVPTVQWIGEDHIIIFEINNDNDRVVHLIRGDVFDTSINTSFILGPDVRDLINYESSINEIFKKLSQSKKLKDFDFSNILNIKGE